MSGLLAAGASALAFEARWISVDSYRLGVGAMLAGSVAFGLIGASRRWASAVSLSIASTVGTSYLAVLSQGPASPDSAWVLGFVAALEAIACRGVGAWIRKGSGDPGSKLARPLDFASLLLMVAAIPMGHPSPMTMVLVAVASVLMVGCFPSSLWFYGTYLAVGTAIYRAWLAGFSWDGLIPFVVLAAYLSWGISVALQRYGPGIRGRLGLADLAFEGPPIRMAVVLGVLASAFRFMTIADAGGGWAALPWLPWALAGLCLLMLRFEPGRGWVHAAVALTGLGFVAILAPVLEPHPWWFSAAMVLSSVWALASRGSDRVEASFRRRLGIAEGHDSGVFAGWGLAAFSLGGLAIVGIVLGTTFVSGSAWASTPWGDILLAIGLAGLFIALEAPKYDRDGLPIGFETLAVLALWWLGASASPLLVRLGIDRNSYLSLITAASAVGVVAFGLWSSGRRESGVIEPGEEIPASPKLGMVRFTSGFGFLLALGSACLAPWTGERVAFLTLLIATSALGLLALGWRRVESAYAGGVTWCLMFAVGAVLAVRELHLPGPYESSATVAIGLVAALFGLWTLAGRVGSRALAKVGDPGDGRVATALERVAIGTAVPSAFLAWIASTDALWLGPVALFALAVFFGMAAWRKRSEWPVYAAQVLLLLAYFRFRGVFAPSGVVDAVILSMLGYLDLGLSEVMGRLRLEHYARPTLRFAMVLPLVPIVRAAWEGHGDDVDLLVLFATSAFYALSGLKLRSKTPAYAAAVLFNAFLWLAWSQLGWRLADRPQFYLIPVGFTSILFAEVNRKEMGRSIVNGARNLGLVAIYASLAAPIWQTQSFGAWLALLLLSLAGVFVGIGLRVQSFLWLGLACFVADLAYQLGRLGMEHALARWGVMLSLGVALILFVALNEKKRIVATMREYYDRARSWE